MTAVFRARHFLRRLSGIADLHHNKLWLLLLLSGILGATDGIATATWQHPVETAQVLLGLVTYDHASLPYAYHATLFSLLNYVAAAILAVTHSEAASSALLAALLGALALQTVAMVVFLVVRNVYLAIAITAALAGISLFGTGISYPILFMGTEHAYGRAGLLFDVYALLWLAFSRFRTGLFLCGIALGVHPAWGLWLNFILALVAVMRYREVRALMTLPNVLGYFVGIALPLVLFAWQKSHYPVAFAGAVADTSAAREIFLNYIGYWDHHRQKADDPALLSGQFFYALVSLVLGVRHFLRAREDQDAGSTLFFLFLIITTLVSAPLVFVPSWFDPSVFPEWFVTLMPGRFIDISIFLGTPLLFAALFGHHGDRLLSTFPAQVLAMLSLFIVAKIQYGNRYAATLVLLAEAILILRHAHVFGSVRTPWLNVRRLGVPVILLACLSPLYAAHEQPSIEAAFSRVGVPQPVTGSILTTMEGYMIQAQTRVSSITPHIDGYVYLGDPAALIALDRFTTDLFGIALAGPPPAGAALHQSGFVTADFKALWEARDCRQWEQLSEKYHFGLILVPAALHLKLRKLDDDAQWNKYRPTCAGAPGAGAARMMTRTPIPPSSTPQ